MSRISISQAQIQQALILFHQGLRYRDISQQTGISTAALSLLLRRKGLWRQRQDPLTPEEEQRRKRYINDRRNRWRRNRRRRCRDCGAITASSYVRCAKCRAKARDRIAQYVKDGRCVKCGRGGGIVAGKRTCEECLSRQRIRDTARRTGGCSTAHEKGIIYLTTVGESGIISSWRQST